MIACGLVVGGEWAWYGTGLWGPHCFVPHACPVKPFPLPSPLAVAPCPCPPQAVRPQVIPLPLAHLPAPLPDPQPHPHPHPYLPATLQTPPHPHLYLPQVGGVTTTPFFPVACGVGQEVGQDCLPCACHSGGMALLGGGDVTFYPLPLCPLPHPCHLADRQWDRRSGVGWDGWTGMVPPSCCLAMHVLPSPTMYLICFSL